jgi:hypothetical protein
VDTDRPSQRALTVVRGLVVHRGWRVLALSWKTRRLGCATVATKGCDRPSIEHRRHDVAVGHGSLPSTLASAASGLTSHVHPPISPSATGALPDDSKPSIVGHDLGQW